MCDNSQYKLCKELTMKNAIYYFSGTGNSFRAAQKIAMELGDTEIISMRVNPLAENTQNFERIGFVFPVYHWTVPEPVVQFVEKLKVNKNAYIFAVAMPSIVLGFGLEKFASILEQKSCVLNYGRKVHSVANYSIVYPPFPSAKIVVPRTEKKLNKIAKEIKAKTFNKYKKAGFIVRSRYEKVMPQYKSLVPFADVPFTISAECVSCGLCSKVCPCKNIELVSKKPTFLHHCNNCMACVAFCPKRAIGYKLTDEHIEEINKSGAKVPIVKMMGLPAKRKLYHNPYVSSADLTKDRIEITGENKL